MENASKALIMAASILLGVMIMSVAVALFNSFGGSSSNIVSKIEQSQINEFNSQFLKYYGNKQVTDDGKTIQEGISVYDVVTIINLAKQNNVKYDVKDLGKKSDETFYVQVDIPGNNNIETKEDDKIIDLIEKKDLKYGESITINNETVKPIINPYIVDKIEISKKTGRVNYVLIKANPNY